MLPIYAIMISFPLGVSKSIRGRIMTAGYSGTPLVKKLGIKAGAKIAIIHPPDNYDDTLGDLPADIQRVTVLDEPLEFIQFFTRDRWELEQEFPALKGALLKNGMLWISWPKASAKIKTDLTENIIRDIGLANKLVDVKVCAVDAIWSGLKFVYRVEDR
jgi:hypothetical protein